MLPFAYVTWGAPEATEAVYSVPLIRHQSPTPPTGGEFSPFALPTSAIVRLLVGPPLVIGQSVLQYSGTATFAVRLTCVLGEVNGSDWTLAKNAWLPEASVSLPIV